MRASQSVIVAWLLALNAGDTGPHEQGERRGLCRNHCSRVSRLLSNLTRLLPTCHRLGTIPSQKYLKYRTPAHPLRDSEPWSYGPTPRKISDTKRRHSLKDNIANMQDYEKLPSFRLHLRSVMYNVNPLTSSLSNYIARHVPQFSTARKSTDTSVSSPTKQ